MIILFCFECFVESSDAAAEWQHPSRVTCGQCSESFTSPWLLLRHAHDAHALPVCSSDQLVSLPLSTTSTPHHQRVNGAVDESCSLPPTCLHKTLTSDDTAPTLVDVRSASPSRSDDDLDWPDSRTPVTEHSSPIRGPDRQKSQSPVDSTRLQRLQRYLVHVFSPRIIGSGKCQSKLVIEWAITILYLFAPLLSSLFLSLPAPSPPLEAVSGVSSREFFLIFYIAVSFSAFEICKIDHSSTVSS